eukprot:CAMPEP_0206383464 /NCGR_PEP_ID=MMETSP0294-20121207/13943_1 /ASSEMBLY_ACC=CAM_ASM_000327 /TAXON_ID=39354 /ORGANISM="Heterosigma akashiwo, Strain CCMP2393" /LENGTH=131 /DNA_ID=CAMNT_0053833485 /DNA_START=134 /DNA_END=529 /DNA_ORIENTATION=-
MTFYVKGAVGSKWKNPFSVKKYGRDKCLKMYSEYIKEHKTLYMDLEELKGKKLGCWCAPEGCHGDVLVSLVQGEEKKREEEDTIGRAGGQATGHNTDEDGLLSERRQPKDNTGCLGDEKPITKRRRKTAKP